MLKASVTQGTGANNSQGSQASGDVSDIDVAYKQRLHDVGLIT